MSLLIPYHAGRQLRTEAPWVAGLTEQPLEDNKEGRATYAEVCSFLPPKGLAGLRLAASGPSGRGLFQEDDSTQILLPS